MFRKLMLLPPAALVIYRMAAKGHTTKIDGEQAIYEMRKIPVNDTKLAVMIRGKDRRNPVLLCVTGGPCGTDIPIIKKYEKELEEHFTIVHYDQRGAGKSLEFLKDYSKLTADVHVNDLLALTAYICYYLNQEKVYILGHSYGTYLASQAVHKDSLYYKAYIGIGQMSDMVKAELESVDACIEAAREAGNKKDVKALEKVRPKVEKGDAICPRKYVRKYKFAEREETHAGRDLMKNVFAGPEYNITDGIKFFYGAMRYAYPLAMQAMKKPLTDIVKSYPIPAFFLMGKYDHMTSIGAAKDYYDSLGGEELKEFIVFENSAHSPHVEENKKFTEWMCTDLLEKTK